MGKKDKMCDYKDRWHPWYSLTDKPEPDTDYTDEGRTQFVKAKRVTCPKCKRRVKADIRAGHDGDVMWRVPPHKRKRWWKKNRRAKK